MPQTGLAHTHHAPSQHPIPVSTYRAAEREPSPSLSLRVASGAIDQQTPHYQQEEDVGDSVHRKTRSAVWYAYWLLFCTHVIHRGQPRGDPCSAVPTERYVQDGMAEASLEPGRGGIHQSIRQSLAPPARRHGRCARRSFIIALSSSHGPTARTFCCCGSGLPIFHLFHNAPLPPRISICLLAAEVE